MPMFSLYAFKVDYDVALASLENVEDFMLASCGLFLHPTNPPLNRLPIRKHALDGSERGSGYIPHVWNFVLPLAAIHDWIDEFFIISTVHVATREVTINTLDIESEAFGRWNAKFFRPIPGQDYDYDPVDQLSVAFRQRMLLVEFLPEP